jgi:hypothetical protein
MRRPPEIGPPRWLRFPGTNPQDQTPPSDAAVDRGLTLRHRSQTPGIFISNLMRPLVRPITRMDSITGRGEGRERARLALQQDLAQSRGARRGYRQNTVTLCLSCRCVSLGETLPAGMTGCQRLEGLG